jgi:hypothetical protein
LVFFCFIESENEQKYEKKKVYETLMWFDLNICWKVDLA